MNCSSIRKRIRSSGNGIVTGVSYGNTLAPAFARQGYATGRLSRHSESGDPVAVDIFTKGGEALLIPTDVTHRQSVNEYLVIIRSHL